MPLTGLYTWTEKIDIVKIIIPLKGSSPKNVDIFVTSSTLKVNFSPYIVDILLFSTIDPLKHKATVKDGSLHVTIYKAAVSMGLWGDLEIKTEDKLVATKLREESRSAQDALEVELGVKRRDRRTDDERFSLKKQMGLEEDERNNLDNLKQEEKRSAEEEVYATFARMHHSSAKATDLIEATVIDASEVITPDIVTNGRDSKSGSPTNSALLTSSSTQKEIFEISDVTVIDEDSDEYDMCDSAVADSKGLEKVEYKWTLGGDAEDIRYIPPPRVLSNAADCKVNVQFTPRIFPTPMRESKAAEEEDWIAKNHRHLSKHSVLGGHGNKGNLLDTTENDPAWLKSKADEFYRGGDYLSSVSAYSAAIELDKSIPALYSNRSACYMQLLMLSECRRDCTEGIRLIDEELAGILSRQSSSSSTYNAVHGESVSLRVMLTKLLMRRGSASCQVGAFTEALCDFTRSYNLLFGYLSKASTSAGTLDQVKNQSHDAEFSLPGVTKASLLVDLEKVEKLLKAEALKKEGDALFAEEKLSESHGKYTDALHLVPVHVGCLSNRSACSLTSKNIHSCIDDCSDALSILRDTDSSSSRRTCGGSQFDMLNSILPRVGSAKRTSWVVKTLLRRGAAHAQLNHLAEAIEDYSAAFVLEPLNEVLKSDLDKMIAYREARRAGTVLEA